MAERGAVPTLEVGQPVTWFHTMRGGYGFVERVSAVVWRVGPKRVTIILPDKNGDPIKRTVDPKNLVPKPVTHA